MTYEEFLRNSLEEKSGGVFDINDSSASWKEGWEEHNIYPNGNGGWKDDLGNPLGFPDDMPVYDYYIERESESAQVMVMFSYDDDSGQYMIDWVRVFIYDFESVAVDVASEEIGTIDAVDALLGTGLDAASKKAEELKKRKLVTVANLQKALEDYDERKGTAVEDGEPVEGKNKVFIDGSGRVYARSTELARQSGLDDEKSDRQRADRDLSAKIAKKADKEHTHKAADITDLPNYARSVNGEEPDADGNVEIDIDAVVEVAELPGETKKKVYLVPEVTTEKTIVDCSSVESIMSAIADRVTGETGHSINSIEDFFIFARKITPEKHYSDVGCSILSVTLEIPGGVTDDGHKSNTITVQEHTVFPNDIHIIDEKTGATLFPANKGFTVYYFDTGFAHFVGEGYDSGLVTFYMKGRHYYISPVSFPSSFPTSMYFGEDSRTPPAVYAKSVELATKEALSEATSGADEKAAALGERIGAVESRVATAKADIATMKSDISTAKTNITAMKSNITEAQANITEAQANITTAKSDITKAQSDIEAVTSEVGTVKADVAALEGKVVRSVNGTEPDENGNVEVASSSGASGKNDTITVSDTDSAVSDDTGILSGESKENPKGLLRFAASKIWDYIRGKIASVLKISYENGYAIISEDAIIKGSIETPNFHINGDGLIYSSAVRRGTKTFTSSGSGENEVRVNFDKIKDDDYVLFFEITGGAEWISCPIQVSNKDNKGFDITVYTNTEDETIEFEYTAIALH